MRERALETWICENPDEAFGNGTEIIGRQVVLPNGILDILAWDGNILAVELKARKLKAQDVSQVLRYVGDLGDVLRGIGQRDCPYEYGTKQFDLWCQYFCVDQHSLKAESAIEPVLVGLSLDSKVAASAAAAKCTVFLWRFTTKGRICLEPFLYEGEHRFRYRPGWVHKLLDKIDEAIEGADTT